ncbi:hypothetical protein MNEG_12568 [Monoraphidium neglectum]|uniref:Uncharacterized protein n=1 Tax=Monoraphidium neglectum TaxID=145388 RepID=A0A0D2MKE5_9CHLO|nr:hypothetical protein MNEG_12568 [Monoraphidium neglectum]KIY95395.1 hypothetical protein MNEG_12568 [Monoraphidium neglectum]|eukprot:XP_013894415.1 hypothetical protein MNEG_12568 [Monoraphidium neglectum]
MDYGNSGLWFALAIVSAPIIWWAICHLLQQLLAEMKAGLQAEMKAGLAEMKAGLQAELRQQQGDLRADVRQLAERLVTMEQQLSSVLRAAVAAPVPGAPTADAANSRIQTLFVPRAKIDVDDNNVVLPLCKGRLRGSRNTTILYIVIDASTAAAAEAWGANLAPPLAAAAASRAAQNASAAGGMPTCAGGNLEFAATVDFAAGNRSVTPGPTAFPPSSFSPGPKALPGYSPLAAVGGVVLNAPHVGVLQGDKLVGQAGRVVRFNQGYTKVVLATTHGYAQGREVIYLSTDASDPLAAALENVPLAPAIGATPPAALAGLVAFTNGATGAENMQRQGLASAIKDGLSPLNVLQSFPGQVAA